MINFKIKYLRKFENLKIYKLIYEKIKKIKILNLKPDIKNNRNYD
jgi:hypothetical protein